MLTSIKLFFGTSLGKNLLLAAAFALVMTAVYQYGSHRGYESGHTAGVKAGKEGQQPTIDRLETQVDALTNKINDDTKTRNEKIQQLESDLNEQVIKNVVANAAADIRRTQIIDTYISNVPKMQQDSCGLTVDEVKVINSLIDTQVIDPIPAIPTEAIKDGESK